MTKQWMIFCILTLLAFVGYTRWVQAVTLQNCLVQGKVRKSCLDEPGGCGEYVCVDDIGSPNIPCDTCAFVGANPNCSADPQCGRCVTHCGHNSPGSSSSSGSSGGGIPTGTPAVFVGSSSGAIRIIDPLNDDKLVMEGVSQKLKKPDDTNLDTLTAGVLGNPGTLTWEFAGFVFPNGNQDVSVEVHTPSPWPQANSFWGEKTIKLTADDGTVDTADDAVVEIEVKVFFDPRIPIGQAPAWYVYYNDTVVDGLSDLTYNQYLAVSSLAMLSSNGEGATDVDTGEMWIGPQAFVLGGSAHVAEVVIHEKKHSELILGCLGAPASDDSDGDKVLNSVEIANNLDPHNPDTHGIGGAYPDNEWLAIQANANYQSIYHATKDWAKDDNNINW